MITVYHNFKFMVYSIAALNTDKQATLGKVTVTVTAVAHANTDSLGEAYQLTNHIETGWEENKKVKVVGMAKNHRSTSVGDILMDTDGGFHVVEPEGFRKLSPEEIADITFYTISKQEEAKLNA